MKRVLYLAGIAGILTSACTASTPPETARLMNSYCPSEPTEWPAERTFELAEDGPPGMLSPRQALQRAKQAAAEYLLRFRSASFRFDQCHTLPQTLVDKSEPTPRPAWEVNMRGSFESDGVCTAGWLIILDARTGDTYLSGESGLNREADCSTAG